MKTNEMKASLVSRFVIIKEKFCVSWYKEDDSTLELIIKGVAEMIGTGILVFLGCLGCIGSMGNVPSHLQICFGFGFAVIIAMTSVAHISGAHINPAVTLGAVICGHKSVLSALIYFIGQTIGGIAGFGLIKIITPQNYVHSGNPKTTSSFCITLLNSNVSVLQGVLCEIVATAVLVFMSCAVNNGYYSCKNDFVAIKFGFAVVVLCFGFIPYTGCSMNPARSFGPALLNNQWSQHWIYWFGPFVGAVLSSIVYKIVFESGVMKKKIIDV